VILDLGIHHNHRGREGGRDDGHLLEDGRRVASAEILHADENVAAAAAAAVDAAAAAAAEMEGVNKFHRHRCDRDLCFLPLGNRGGREGGRRDGRLLRSRGSDDANVVGTAVAAAAAAAAAGEDDLCFLFLLGNK